MTDMLGHEVNAGDFVLIGKRVGNEGQLGFGIMIDPDKGSVLSGTYQKWCVERGYDPFRINGARGYGLDDGRVLKVDTAMFPEMYAKLYEKAKQWL